jgi:hypothetical protein
MNLQRSIYFIVQILIVAIDGFSVCSIGPSNTLDLSEARRRRREHVALFAINPTSFKQGDKFISHENSKLVITMYSYVPNSFLYVSYQKYGYPFGEATISNGVDVNKFMNGCEVLARVKKQSRSMGFRKITWVDDETFNIDPFGRFTKA